MNIIKILGGLIVLFLGFYGMYLGAELDNMLITILGVLISIIGAIVVFFYRYKQNMKTIYKYKKVIEELKKDPDNEELIKEAYKHGKEFYQARKGNIGLTKKDKAILERDINFARGKLR